MTATRTFESADELARVLAEELAEILGRAIALRGRASLVVSGGRTPVRMFERLRTQPIDWNNVTVTLADERWVDRDHADSNERLVRGTLLDGPAAQARFVPLKGPEETPQEAMAGCAARLAEVPRPFDAVVLGMGNDGHTASLFPDWPELAEGVDLETAATCLPVAVQRLRHPRVTLTLPVLCDAQRLFVHIEGADKRATLDRARAPGPIDELPIRAVLRQRRAPVEVYWAPVDREAA